MFVLNDYLDRLIEGCRSAFGGRLLYVGLQGSYLRGEANESSDIDVMAVVDGLTVSDMDRYRDILKSVGYYERSCGFICGKAELARWNPLEICQLVHTTKDLFGALEGLLPPASREDEINYVKLSLGNIYHEICHRYIHADREKNISGFYAMRKSLFFLMQNLYYLESGEFVVTKKALMERLPEDDRELLALAEPCGDLDFDRAVSMLFGWCQKAFARLDRLDRRLPDGAAGRLKMAAPLLYRAALRGVFGGRSEYGQAGIADALFVFLDGKPDPEAAAALEARYRVRPLVCLTESWEDYIRARYPEARVYRRCMMKPARRFLLPEESALPEGYRLAAMDEAAFERHPFSHGANYASCAAFQAEGSGAVAYWNGEIVASASSFLSMDGEVELDVSTKEEHQGKGLASACVARMLRDCMERGIAVHWDAQNEISRHLAEKFGFEMETEYSVYWLPA